MDLGCFSMSLTVKDIEASKSFYETLGFSVLDGDVSQKWLILQNGESKIGLFEGMFDANMLSFNPGNVRALQQKLKDAGYTLEAEAEGTEGPGCMSVKDPDGNVLFFDQY